MLSKVLVAFYHSLGEYFIVRLYLSKDRMVNLASNETFVYVVTLIVRFYFR